MKSTRTSSRKQQHIDITLTKDVSFRTKTSGFDRLEFVHNALPELNLSETDSRTPFLGKNITLPFVIASMTGGYAKAEHINRQLAEVCARKNIALGIGSQRQALEDAKYHRSYSIVREVAPAIPVFGNIGAVEVAKLKSAAPILRMIELIQADGFAVHLNPLQELLQPEGDTNFRGVLAGIEMLVNAIPVPLIVKEIGAGISAEVARRLINVGVKIIDIAGSGGTSWAGVEIIRSNRGKETGEQRKRKSNIEAFWDWGIPTADALQAVCALKGESSQIKVIASGGISSGIDAAKSIVIGADYVAFARPVLNALDKGGIKKVLGLIDTWEWEFKGVMFLTGSKSVAELQKQRLSIKA